MATSRTELIMAAVTSELTGLFTTGNLVFRGRVYPFQDNQMPGLAVYMGDDRLREELQTSLLDWNLSLFIEIYVKSAAAQIDTVLNTIRKEIHEALMTDETHGLGFVISTTPADADQPELRDEGNQPIAVQKLEYVIMYRTSRGALDA